MFHTRDLRYFIAVAEHLHFTRAAASLSVSQPALSKQIASLERNLEVELFVRRHDGVALTAAGVTLLPYARQMVELDDEAVDQVRCAARSAQRLTIGFWLAPASEILSRTMTTFAALEPDIKLGIRRADWAQAAAGVLAYQADVALVETPHDQPLPGVRSHRLAVEDILVALPLDHRLADRDVIELGDLTSETIFTVPRSNGQKWQPSRRKDTQWRPGHVGYVTTIDETVEGILLGLGVGLLTPSIAATYLNRQVCTVPLRGADPSDYCIVWRKDDEHRPEVKHLVECLVGAYGAWLSTREWPAADIAPRATRASRALANFPLDEHRSAFDKGRKLKTK